MRTPSPATSRTDTRIAAAKPQHTWAGRVDVARLRAAFDAAALSLTIGAEEELLLVDHGADDLAPVVAEALTGMGADSRFHPEFREAQIEVVT